jgi:hypothetical protein
MIYHVLAKMFLICSVPQNSEKAANKELKRDGDPDRPTAWRAADVTGSGFKTAD